MYRTIPEINQTKKSNINYLRVKDTLDINKSSDTLTLDYKMYDNITSAELRDAIATALNNYSKRAMNEEAKKYIRNLEKSNSGLSFNVDYKKLAYDKCDCDIDLEKNLRETIQLILIKRARVLYMNMEKSPTY